MSDLISREAVLNKIAEIDELSKTGKTDEALALMKECFESLTPKQTEWISVKDRLPTENDEYYVSIRYECDDGTAFDDVTTCYFWAKEGVWNGSERMIGKILAWQPITEPSPYKGGNNR